MSMLAEIEAAVDQLSPTQQQELHIFLGDRLRARLKPDLSLEEFESWFKTAWGAGRPDVTTDDVMAMTRGEE